MNWAHGASPTFAAMCVLTAAPYPILLHAVQAGQLTVLVRIKITRSYLPVASQPAVLCAPLSSRSPPTCHLLPKNLLSRSRQPCGRGHCSPGPLWVMNGGLFSSVLAAAQRSLLKPEPLVRMLGLIQAHHSLDS